MAHEMIPPFDLRVEVQPCGCGHVNPTTERGYAWLVDHNLTLGDPGFRAIQEARHHLDFKPEQLRTVLPVAKRDLVVIITVINPATHTPSESAQSQAAAHQLSADLNATVLRVDGDDRRN